MNIYRNERISRKAYREGCLYKEILISRARGEMVSGGNKVTL